MSLQVQQTRRDDPTMAAKTGSILAGTPSQLFASATTTPSVRDVGTQTATRSERIKSQGATKKSDNTTTGTTAFQKGFGFGSPGQTGQSFKSRGNSAKTFQQRPLFGATKSSSDDTLRFSDAATVPDFPKFTEPGQSGLADFRFFAQTKTLGETPVFGRFGVSSTSTTTAPASTSQSVTSTFPFTQPKPAADVTANTASQAPKEPNAMAFPSPSLFSFKPSQSSLTLLSTTASQSPKQPNSNTLAATGQSLFSIKPSQPSSTGLSQLKPTPVTPDIPTTTVSQSPFTGFSFGQVKPSGTRPVFSSSSSSSSSMSSMSKASSFKSISQQTCKSQKEEGKFIFVMANLFFTLSHFFAGPDMLQYFHNLCAPLDIFSLTTDKCSYFRSHSTFLSTEIMLPNRLF